MPLVNAVHHIATATNDLNRMITFYREAFELDPKPGFPMDTPVGRIAFYDIGGVELQVVEGGTIEPAEAANPAILLQENLRLDHFTLRIDDAESFTEVRDRLVALEATDGEVADFNGQSLLAFVDPDGHRMEIISA